MDRRLTAIVLLILCLAVAASWQRPTQAQDATPTPTVTGAENGIVDSDTNVYVTTQDRASLRRGPSVNFERITILQPGVTLQAIGRSADTRWVQVIYGEETGWIAYWLLVWSGDIITLPVDGVNPAPFVRIMGVVGITTRETRIYERQVTPSDQIGVIPAGELVEVVGRLGDFWYQIRYQGQLYWVGAWDIRITRGNPYRVLDTAYLFAYGRLLNELSRDSNTALNTLIDIELIWIELAEGRGVTCDYRFRYPQRRTPQGDLNAEPAFQPVADALDSAIAQISIAISAYEDACSRAELIVTEAEVYAALEELESARRDLTFALALLSSLRNRNPLEINTEQP
jgi:uncharacterized protein YgiM (DUF1202 family)